MTPMRISKSVQYDINVGDDRSHPTYEHQIMKNTHSPQNTESNSRSCTATRICTKTTITLAGGGKPVKKEDFDVTIGLIQKSR